MKALVMNRLGDIGFLVGSVLVFTVYNTFDFTILHLLSFKNFNTIYFSTAPMLYYRDLLCMFFLIGIAGKSAQLGLHT
jgi:NADH:ubiquinone oxidoreductase subunit 5 (subunit L)/multisubunit Na+/H+ antiporter MnhA subunit